MERVEKIELNIPSVFAHGVFRKDGKDVLLSKKGIEYYYSLIWLVRNELLAQNPNILKKKKKGGYKINNKIKWNSNLDINMYDILNVINPNHKSDFTALKNFIPILNDLWIEINVLNKVKTKASRTIKVVDNVSINNTNKKVSIKFNTDFIKYFMHNKSSFRKVILNHMFILDGFKDKMLYLVIGDYFGITKNIDKKDLYRFIGTNSISKIDKLMVYINEYTDINIQPTIVSKGKYRDTLTLKIKEQVKFLDDYDKVEYYIKKYLWSQAERQTPLVDKNNKPVLDKKKYTKSIYKTLMVNFDDMVEIDLIIENARELLIEYKNTDYKQYIMMTTNDNNQYMIKDDYTLVDYTMTPATSTIKATASILKNIESYEINEVDKNNITVSTKSLL
ncbi:MAG: hypothetical protein U9N59_12315 [Campylobacterota bacterium]|nr:hypothetical protein [Campylobacterota bacterium]